MGKFSSDINGLAKSDNTHGNMRAKVAIRMNVLEAVLETQATADVFDAYAGEGHMHGAVWSHATSCVGCDERFFRDDRMAFVADNRRVLRAIDLSAFNLFDLDAYGSPWEQAIIIARRRLLRPVERIGLILTEGQALKLKMGGMSHALAWLADVAPRQPGLGKIQDKIYDRAISRLAALMDARVVHRWQATGKTGSRMSYIGLLLAQGVVKPASDPPSTAQAPGGGVKSMGAESLSTAHECFLPRSIIRKKNGLPYSKQPRDPARPCRECGKAVGEFSGVRGRQRDYCGPACKTAACVRVASTRRQPSTEAERRIANTRSKLRYRAKLLAEGREVRKPVAWTRSKCPQCKEFFTFKRSDRKFCSRKCQGDATRINLPGWNHGNAAKRARRRGVEYESINLWQLFSRDGWRCQICGRKTPQRLRGTIDLRAPEVDHRTPLRLGGSHTYGNCQLACRGCNNRKGGVLILGQLSMFPTVENDKGRPAI